MTSRPDEGGGPAPPNCRRLFTIEQAADHAGVPTLMMRHWIGAGKLESYCLEGGRIRIDEIELAAFLQAAVAVGEGWTGQEETVVAVARRRGSGSRSMSRS